MTWTYSGNPAASPKDALRFAVGDTREAKPLLTDEELLACLATADGNLTAAAVIACRGVLFQLGRNRDESVGSVSISFSQQYDHYAALLGQLEGQLGLFGSFTVYAGGISRRDAQDIAQDPDRFAPGFSRVGNDRLRPAGALLDNALPLGQGEPYAIGE